MQLQKGQQLPFGEHNLHLYLKGKRTEEQNLSALSSWPHRHSSLLEWCLLLVPAVLPPKKNNERNNMKSFSEYKYKLSNCYS